MIRRLAISAGLAFALVRLGAQESQLGPSPAPAPSGSESAPAGEGGQQGPAAKRSAGPDTPFHYGPILAHPGLTYAYQYASGIQAAPGQPSDSVVQNLTASVGLELGTHWSVDYAPTWKFYSNPGFRDTVDQSADVGTSNDFDDWPFRLSQSFAVSTSPLVETGSQTTQHTYVTSFGAEHELASWLGLELGAVQNIGKANVALGNSRSWSSTDGLQFDLPAQLKLDASIDAGYTAVEHSTQLVHESPGLQLSWTSSDGKAVANAGFGYEQQQYLGKKAPSNRDLEGSAALTLQPIEASHLSLSTGQSQSFSTLTNQATQSLTSGVTMAQTLLKHYSLLFGFQAAKVKYLASPIAQVPGRTDLTHSFNFGFSVNGILRRGNLSVTYSHTHNSSTTPGLGVSTQQIGVQLGYRY